MTALNTVPIVMVLEEIDAHFVGVQGVMATVFTALVQVMIQIVDLDVFSVTVQAKMNAFSVMAEDINIVHSAEVVVRRTVMSAMDMANSIAPNAKEQEKLNKSARNVKVLDVNIFINDRKAIKKQHTPVGDTGQTCTAKPERRVGIGTPRANPRGESTAH